MTASPGIADHSMRHPTRARVAGVAVARSGAGAQRCTEIVAVAYKRGRIGSTPLAQPRSPANETR